MKLTQAQLADKYGISQGIVSMILNYYDVICNGKTYEEGNRHPSRLYDEEKAIAAFEAYFRGKAEKARQKARNYDDVAESLRSLYKDSLHSN